MSGDRLGPTITRKGKTCITKRVHVTCMRNERRERRGEGEGEGESPPPAKLIERNESPNGDGSGGGGDSAVGLL